MGWWSGMGQLPRVLLGFSNILKKNAWQVELRHDELHMEFLFQHDSLYVFFFVLNEEKNKRRALIKIML